MVMASPTAHRVFVYSFAPSTDSHALGGFHWNTDRKVIEEAYIQGAKDSARYGGSHLCRFLHVTTDNDPHHDPEEVTEELDARLDELESTLPALRQYIPACTTDDRVPIGRRER